MTTHQSTQSFAEAAEVASEPGIAYINGKFVPLSEAAVPLLDWGFNKSDVVYDGIPFTEGLIFRLDDHLERFEDSMDKWRLPHPTNRDQMRMICHDLVARSELQDGIIYLCTTRGVPPSAEIRDPAKFKSRLYGWSQMIPQLGVPAGGGIRMIISKIPRIPETSVDSTAKNFHWGDLIQARLEANDRGAQNAILLGHGGLVAEGVGFNVFLVKDKAVLTPKHDCLKGITRRTVMEIAIDHGYECREEDITAAELADADEIFISSSAGGVFSVTVLDDVAVADGQPGKVSKELNRIYWEWRIAERLTTRVNYGTLLLP